MNGSVSCPLAHLDGAYVLGALAPEERLEFERHLPGCPACSRSVQLLAGLPGLLSQVSVEVLEPEHAPEPVPDTLLPALVREVRRTQHRRRWLTGLAAAAAVVAVAAGSVAVVNTVGDDGPPPGAPSSSSAAREMTQVGQHTVAASVAMIPVAWGTRLDIVCSYGVPEHEYGGSGGSTYALVVRSREGDVQQVATWKGLPGRTMTLAGATALTVGDIASVEVRAADGHPILELTG